MPLRGRLASPLIVGIAIAYLYSVVALLLPSFFPSGFRLADGTLPLYFAPVALLITLALLGEFLASGARRFAGAEPAPALRQSRGSLAQLALRISGFFTPAVFVFAALAAAAWGIWGADSRFAHGVLAMISVLVVASPFALLLSGPLSLGLSLRRAASVGVRFRDGAAIENLRQAKILVLAKTGTITEGRPRVSAVKPLGMSSEDEVIALAASLEQASRHPLAQAIVALAREWELETAPVREFEAFPGKGVAVLVNGKKYFLGNRALLADFGIDVGRAAATVQLLGSAALTVVLLADEKEMLGLVGIADPVRPEVREGVLELRKQGMEVVMLTGDGRATALAVARFAGIADVIAEVPHAEKAAAVRRLRWRGKVVAMAGDGRSDAKAFARADVRILLGESAGSGPSDISISLAPGDFAGIVRARRLSRLTVRNMRQNLGFALAYNMLGVPIAAGVLFPIFGFVLSPLAAAAAMGFGTISLIANSLRLRNAKI